MTHFEPEGRTVAYNRPVDWIKQGWRLFLKSPSLWIVLTLVMLLILVALTMVPVVGQLAANFLVLIFGAGLLLGCHSLAQGNPLRFDHLFEGFRGEEGTRSLFLVGLLYLIGLIVIMGITFGIAGGDVMMEQPVSAADSGRVLFATLVMLTLTMPLVMAVWFAPALIIFHHLLPIPAMRASFSACMKNMGPFTVYSLLLLVLLILAALPFGLGFLVLLPVLTGAQYASYLDIFE
ncbi:MAG: BPSS1780 family membrane protein [Rhodocyclaceae bacterium]|nr:BPSS1780 family membrane protein [Rhodocyclaceae bacterium]